MNDKIDASLLSYEKVRIEDNRKIMLDCTLIAQADNYEIYQSANRNVITIKHEGYLYHLTLQDIVNSVLMGKI